MCRALWLLFAFAIVAASCGSDNDADGPAAPAPGSAPVTLGPDTSDATTTTADDTSTSTSTPSTAQDPSTTEPSSTSNQPTTRAPSSTAAPSTAAPASTAPTGLSSVSLTAVPVASFQVPTTFRLHPDGSGWVAEKAGRVVSFETGAVALDVRARVRDRGEMGFLGLAFDADGEHLYVSYNDDLAGGDTVIAEYTFRGGAADPATERELLRVDQPYSNHNGGDIHLGPDGYLWIGLGDGGSRGDPHDNGQNPDTLLGSILRIDPTSPSDGLPYGIPPDNPFAGGGGRAETWLFGVRNPWRFHFDERTGDLWVADVGQNAWEEITFLPASSGRGRGANLGWNRLEGTHRYSGSAPDGAVGPVYEYSHDEGCSITGGVVYHGTSISGLQGAYLFADFCRSSVRAIRVENGTTVDAHTFGVDVGTPISFGTSRSGEVLVLSQSGTVYELRG